MPPATCPRCQGNMPGFEEYAVAGERCEGCGGVWVDWTTLDGLVENLPSEYGITSAQDFMFGAGSTATNLTCPRCHTAALLAYNHKGIAVEWCERCSGIYLDGSDFKRFAVPNTMVSNVGKPRLLAMIVDNLVATLVAILISVNVLGVSQIGRANLLIVTYLLYFLIPEALWGRTLGKRIFGLIVLRLDGTRGGWRESLIRTSMRVLEVNPLFLGALPGALFVLFSKRRQRAGDILGGTVVVRHDSRKANPAHERGL